MKRNNKKGFTIVELVIVIAVIAILAAVLIPTFASLVNKANQSADQQAVRQMNTALTMYAAENGKPADVIEAKKALDEALVNVEGGLVPVTQGYAFYWDSTENVVVLVATGDEVKSGWEILTANAYGEQISASSADELLTALATEGPVSITLTENVTLNNAGISSAAAGYRVGSDWYAMDVVSDGEVVTLDLNGKTLKMEGTAEMGMFITKGGNLTVKNGTIDTNKSQTFRNLNGTLVLENVVINDNSTVAAECTIAIRGISDTVITGCTITRTAEGYGIGTNSDNSSADGARVSIIDTKVKSTGDGSAVMINVVADVTIDGCTFEGNYQGLILRGNNAVVKNSTITSVAYASDAYDYYDTFANGANVPRASIVVHAGGGYGGNASYSYAFENVTVNNGVVAGTTNSAKLTVSGITVDRIVPDASNVTVK